MSVSAPTLKTSGNAAGSGSSQATASITLSAGDYLLALHGAVKNAGVLAPTGVSWAGDGGHALTKLVENTTGGGGGGSGACADIWAYKVVTGGSGVVTFTFTGDNNANFWAIVVVTGENATPIGDTDSQGAVNGSGVAPSLTLTTVAGGLVISAIALNDKLASQVTEDAGQTVIYEADDSFHCSSFTYEAAAGTSTTVSYTQSVTDRGYTHCAVAIDPAAGGGGGSSGFLLLTMDDEH